MYILVKVPKLPVQAVSAMDMGKLKILSVLGTNWHTDHINKEDRMTNSHGKGQTAIFTLASLELG
jgi:hypothetical protein